MRLIDADALINTLNKEKIEFNEDINYFILYVPTIDAELVVRCKDCRWGREVCGNIECSVDRNLPPEYHGYEWFCPNGENRTEVEE